MKQVYTLLCLVSIVLVAGPGCCRGRLLLVDRPQPGSRRRLSCGLGL